MRDATSACLSVCLSSVGSMVQRSGATERSATFNNATRSQTSQDSSSEYRRSEQMMRQESMQNASSRLDNSRYCPKAYRFYLLPYFAGWCIKKGKKMHACNNKDGSWLTCVLIVFLFLFCVLTFCELKRKSF